VAISRNQTIKIALPRAEAYETCLKVAEAVPRARLDDFEEESGTIILTVPWSFKSWGERVVLRLSEADPSTTSIEVTSRASFPLTLADYGKNARNVQQVVDWLSDLPGSAPAPR
jgi:hypothetical protein